MSLAQSVVWLTLSEIVFNVAGYIIHSAVGRILGPAEYGRYSLIVTLTTTIIILIGNGIPTAMSKFISERFDKRPEEIASIKRTALLLQIAVMGSVTVLFFFAAPILAHLLGDASLTPLFQLSSLIIPAFAAASFYFSYFTGLHKFNVQALLKTVRAVARVLCIIGLAYVFGTEGTITGYILAPLIVFFIALYADKVFYRQELWQKNGILSSVSAQSILAFAWPLTLFMLFYELLISIDLFLVKRFLHDDFFTGIYNAALTVGRIPYFLFYALTIVLFPAISHSTANKNSTRTRTILSNVLRIQWLLLTPITILMVTYAKPIIQIFYGTTYSSSVEAMQILVVGASFLTLFYVMSFALNGAGKIKIPMLFAATGLAINGLLGWLFIPRFGISGAAWATTVTSFFLMIATNIIIHRNFSVRMAHADIVKVLGAGLVIAFLSQLMKSPSVFMSLFFATCLFIFYFTLLFIMKTYTREDIRLFFPKKITLR